MKSMKSMLIAALAMGALLVGNSTLLAQDNSTNAAPPAARGNRGGRGAMTIDQLTKALNLTDDQKPKVQAVLDDQTKQMADLRADTTLSNADRRTKMQAIRTDITAKMKAILTDEQFTNYQAMIPQRGARRGGAGGNPPANPPAQN